MRTAIPQEFNSFSSQLSGRATQEELHALWRLVLAGLIRKGNTPRTSVEVLALSRAFLHDNRYIGPVDEPRFRRRLDRLHDLYVKGLAAAMSDGTPSASLLSEARIFMEQAKQQQRLLEATKISTALPMTPPFKQPQ